MNSDLHYWLQRSKRLYRYETSKEKLTEACSYAKISPLYRFISGAVYFMYTHDKGGFDLSKPPYQLWKWKLIG